MGFASNTKSSERIPAHTHTPTPSLGILLSLSGFMGRTSMALGCPESSEIAGYEPVKCLLFKTYCPVCSLLFFLFICFFILLRAHFTSQLAISLRHFPSLSCLSSAELRDKLVAALKMCASLLFPTVRLNHSNLYFIFKTVVIILQPFTGSNLRKHQVVTYTQWIS